MEPEDCFCQEKAPSQKIFETRSDFEGATVREEDAVSNVDVVILVLSDLGGVDRVIHSEEVAARAFRAAPARFGWRIEKYRKLGWPDKYVAKTALEDAKKPENGELVEGSYALDLAKDGWRLTPAGVRWIRENADRIRRTLSLGAPPEIPKKDADRFLRGIKEQKLFRDFNRVGALEASAIYRFADLLSCSPDASPDVISAKFRRLRAIAERAQDRQVNEFFDACEETFSQFLASGGKVILKREAE